MLDYSLTENTLTQLISITLGAKRLSPSAGEVTHSVSQQAMLHEAYFIFDPPIAVRLTSPSSLPPHIKKVPTILPDSLKLGCSLYDNEED